MAENARDVFDRVEEPGGQQLDVEDVATVGRLGIGEQIEQQRGEPVTLEGPRDREVARAQPAAAASVREHDDAGRPGRETEDAGKRHTVGTDRDVDRRGHDAVVPGSPVP